MERDVDNGGIFGWRGLCCREMMAAAVAAMVQIQPAEKCVVLEPLLDENHSRNHEL